MHAETIAAEIQAPLRRPRLHVAANDAATLAAACAILGHSAIIADTAADADWVVPLADGDALTADGVAALAALGHGADAPALIIFSAARRVDGADIPMPRFDVRDPAYALAASAGFSLAATVWRADVWAELQGPGAASYAPRFAATRLVETGARICAEPTVLVACTARPFAEPAKGALQNALAITAAISLDGAERRWPQAMLMTMAAVSYTLPRRCASPHAGRHADRHRPVQAARADQGRRAAHAARPRGPRGPRPRLDPAADDRRRRCVRFAARSARRARTPTHLE
ncbi:MAG: hypothetical protein EBZ50_16390, partial [Alphaproteobacteria bacterium]|nr:hypothetical protein [Alphaproteobacteria bacterium]